MKLIMKNDKSNRGLAAIPLVLLFAVMIIAIPLAIKKSQEVATVQNRAAAYSQLGEDCSAKPCDPSLKCARKGDTYVCQGINTTPTIVPCSEIVKMKQQFCSTNGALRPVTVPCSELNKMFTTFCSPTSTPKPISCYWCGNKCIDSRMKIPCSLEKPPKGASCVVADNKCLILYSIVKPTVTPTAAARSCINGQTKMVGGLRFTCIKGVWVYTK